MLAIATILHVLFASAWFGHKLLIPRDVRISVRQPETVSLLIDRMARAQTLGIISGIGTLGTGLWLIDLSSGFGGVPVEIYVAGAAVLAMFVVGVGVATPAWRTIRRALEAENIPDAVAGVSRFNRAINLESLLWILALTMMFL